MTQQKTVVIVESPAKAHKIQEILGKDFAVIASCGHIVDLIKGGSHGMGIDIEKNFKAKYAIIDDKISVLEDITDLVADSKEVILSTDNDREGLAIAFHLYERLKDYNKTFKRITFSEITKKGILEAMKKPQDIDSIENVNMFKSQEARRILDRLVGFMASPFLMDFFGDRLSAGRVQSVVVRMVADREEEIEIFEPEEYWNIFSKLQNSSKANFSAKYDKKVKDGETAKDIKSALEGNNLDAIYIVNNVNASEEKKKAPAPLITAKLQQIMSKGHNLSADKTMKAAQSLYENGYITYMRTDSTRTSDEAVKAARDYLKNKNYSIPTRANTFKNKDAAQDAHECIRPTDLTLEPSSPELIGDEAQVYEVIWRNFLASQMTPAIYNTLKVSLVLKADQNHILKASGKALKDEGYLKILGISDDSKIDIPDLKVNEELVLFGKDPVTIEQKFTQPPGRYSEANLIDVLDKKNIGRPATYAELLSKITSRNYVEKHGNVFHPTELGRKITNELVKYFSFMEYDYTAAMEKNLDLIADGKVNQTDMLSEFFKPFKEELTKAYVNHGSEICSQCKSPMKLKVTKTGKFWGCSSYPKCKFTISVDIENVQTA